jgi:hypothetical protein
MDNSGEGAETHRPGPPKINHHLLLEGCFEAIICQIHVELKFASLIVGNVLSSAHLIESDEPLYYFGLVLKILVCDLVDGLDGFNQNGMERVLGEHIHLDGIEQSDEVLRG